MSLTANPNRVPAKQWRRWSPTARAIFERVYAFMLENPGLMQHPRQPSPAPAHWKTTAWNAAWIAADACDDTIPTTIETVTRRRA